MNHVNYAQPPSSFTPYDTPGKHGCTFNQFDMRWVGATQLETWAGERLDARAVLPRLIGQLVRASASDIGSFRFPGADSSQIPGWDGRLIANASHPLKAYVPEGASVWEFGADKNPATKAGKDYAKRRKKPGEGITQAETTFVFVTPRTWAGAEKWIDRRKAKSPWREIRVIDAVDLEEWMGLCPGVAATFARENNFAPRDDVQSIDEFWDLYSGRFTPPLSEKVLLAGRSGQVEELQRALMSGVGVQRCRGDSLDEVLAFLCATVRSADDETREYLRARTLIIQSEEAARQLRDKSNLIFAVRGAAMDAGGMLADRGHRVIAPIGRDAARGSSWIELNRPTAYEMREGLEFMGFSPERAWQLAHECGRSVSILARRIPSTSAPRPSWSNDNRLVAAFLAGAWDQSVKADTEVVAALAGANSYEEVEQSLRSFLTHPDSPIELIGTVWSVRAPVDLFVQISNLLQARHWQGLTQAAHRVLAEVDPALELPPSERMYASLRGKVLSHSSWLRDGLTTTLLILGALGAGNEVSVNGRPPQEFVNHLVGTIPGLREDYRVIASLSHQLPMLMEAAPDPLLHALEQMLEGDAPSLKAIFQDRKDDHTFWSSSPHTGVLWALELIGQDPKYLQPAVNVLARLDAIDPGGTLANRPIGSIVSLLSTWKPTSNASHELRVAVLDHVIATQPAVAWKLLLAVLPSRHAFQLEPIRPRFREAGASEREILTYKIVDDTISEIASRAVRLANAHEERWAALLEDLHDLPPRDRETIIQAFSVAMDSMAQNATVTFWEKLSEITRRHRSFPSEQWVLPEREIEVLEAAAAIIAPRVIGAEDRYLFTEKLPHIPQMEIRRVGEQIGEYRLLAVKKLMSAAGTEGVVRFAAEVESPRHVGSAFGMLASSPDEILDGIYKSADRATSTVGFAASASAAAYERFGEAWSSAVRESVGAGTMSRALMQELVKFWPLEEKTWKWVAQFGEEAERQFWQNREPWGIRATGPELVYAVDQYLRFERPEHIIFALSGRASEIPTDRLITTLTSFEDQASLRPHILRWQALDFHIKQLFNALRSRDGVPLETTAALEYRFLPLLRGFWRNTDPDSSLDRFMAESPTFFIQVISDVFRRASQRNEPKSPLNPEQQARVSTGMTLLESFSRIPGLSAAGIDAAALNDWVQTARNDAKNQDRLKIAEQYIGKLLTHAPNDPTDQLWPHRAVRDGLEKWQSTEIEKGIHIGKMNSRGATARAPFEGGKQERDLAQQLRRDAARMDNWPRTRGLLISLAESWESLATREDLEAEQLRMRE